MKPFALMIDTETLGLRPRSHILQVAAELRDLDHKKTLAEFCVGLIDQEQTSRVIDIGTVRWWMGQDQEVAKGVFYPAQRVSKLELYNMFASALSSVEKQQVEVWANPSPFDIPLLESLWAGAPWSHRQTRCLKTAASILDPYGELVPPPNGLAHDALADVKWQLDYLQAMYDKE